MTASKADIDRLYDFLSDFKGDITRRFDEQALRFADYKKDVDRRFGDLDKRMDNLRGDFQRYESRLNEVYDCRREVTVKFTRDWRFASLLIAMGASGLTLCIAVIVSRLV